MSGRQPSSVGGSAAALVVAVLVIGTVAAGCATSSPAPPAWQRASGKVATSPYGAWTNVKLTTGAVISGELLAVADSAVYLGANPVLHQLPVRCVDTLTIADQEVNSDASVVLGLLGTASTVTHGFLLGLSAPVWLITTVATTRGLASAGYRAIRPLSAPRTAPTMATVVTRVDGDQRWAPQAPVVVTPPPPEPDIASTAAPSTVDTILSATIDPHLREAVEFARFPQGLPWVYVRGAPERETLNRICARTEVE